MQIDTWTRNRTRGALLLVASVMSCAPPDVPASRPGSVIADVVVSITNETVSTQEVFLEAGASRHSLGVVRGQSSRAFPVPGEAGDSTRDLELVARRRSLAPVRSGVFRLSPGTRAIWTLKESERSLSIIR
jgi:hypothetical protein